MTGDLFARLRTTSQLRFDAQSAGEERTGWNGVGAGRVVVETFAPNVLIFRETGTWRQDSGKEFQFTNVFRWTELTRELIRLDHLRLCWVCLVFLFDLIPDSAESAWISAVGHPCRDDCYTGRIELESDSFRFVWKVEGPRKSETIEYVYS